MLKTMLLAVPNALNASRAAAWASLGWALRRGDGAAAGASETLDGELPAPPQADADGVPLPPSKAAKANKGNSPELSSSALGQLLDEKRFDFNFLDAILNALSIKDNTDLCRMLTLARDAPSRSGARKLKRQEAVEAWAEKSRDYRNVALSSESGALHVGLVCRKRVKDIVDAVRFCTDHRISTNELRNLASDIESVPERPYATLETFAGIRPGLQGRKYSIALHTTTDDVLNNQNQQQRMHKEWLGDPVGIVVATRVSMAEAGTPTSKCWPK